MTNIKTLFQYPNSDGDLFTFPKFLYLLMASPLLYNKFCLAKFIVVLWNNPSDIDAYENSMIRNIYSYWNNNHFSSAIFMCGAAYRKSIIEKI